MDTYDLKKKRIMGLLRIVTPMTMQYYRHDVEQYAEIAPFAGYPTGPVSPNVRV